MALPHVEVELRQLALLLLLLVGLLLGLHCRASPCAGACLCSCRCAPSAAGPAQRQFAPNLLSAHMG